MLNLWNHFEREIWKIRLIIFANSSNDIIMYPVEISGRNIHTNTIIFWIIAGIIYEREKNI